MNNACKKRYEHFPLMRNIGLKVGGKMFALTKLKQWLEPPSLNLKCDPRRALELRANFEAVQPG
jgi:predicted DNA-binding protein (MmcQ/YjbR family)